MSFTTIKTDMSLLVCTICKNRMIDPRILPCKHSFCLHCLKESFPLSGAVNECLICKNNFSLGSNLNSLPINEFIVKLGSIKVPIKGCCDTCEDKPAKKYCMSCDHHFCTDCLGQHNKIKLNQPHQLVEVNSPSYKDALSGNKYRKCPDHNQDVDVFCKDCKEYICLKCTMFSHKPHDYLEIKTKLEDEKSKLESTITRLKDSLVTYTKELNIIEKYRMDKKKEMLSEINSKGNALKAEIDQYVKKLIEKVENHFNESSSANKYNRATIFYKSAEKEKTLMEANLKSLEQKLENLCVNTIMDLGDYDEKVPVWKPSPFQKHGIKFVSGKTAVSFKDILGFIYVDPFLSRLFVKPRNENAGEKIS